MAARPRPLAWWAGLTLATLVLQHLSNRVLREPGYLWRWHDVPYYLQGFSQFDGVRYADIAANGYSYTPGEPSNIVYFPVYPLLMRALDPVVTQPLVAGFLITVVSAAAALVLFDRWCGAVGVDGRARLAAVAAIALYPYSFFLYGAVYADALFLALVVAAFLLVERDHRLAAAVAGALATATRPTGLALIPAVLLIVAQRDGVLEGRLDAARATGRGLADRLRRGAARVAWPARADLRRVRWSTIVPLGVVGGIGGFATFLGVAFGDPLLFVNNQTTYHPGSYGLFKAGQVGRWLDVGENPTAAVTTTAQMLIVLGVIALIPAVARRFGIGYGVYTVVLVTIPFVSSGDFMGSGRYLIAAFPTFALLGEHLAARPRLALPLGVVSGTVMLFLGFGYSRSWYLS